MRRQRRYFARKVRFPSAINNYSIILGLLVFSQVVLQAPL